LSLENTLSKFGISPRHISGLKDFFASNKLIYFMHGAIRASKTDAQILAHIIQCTEHPGEYFAIGKTLDSLKRNVLEGERKFKYWLGPQCYHKGDNILDIEGSITYFLGANNIEAESKIRGGTFHGGLHDELPLLPKNLVKHSIGRCSKPGARMFWAGNPESPYHWAKTDYIDNNPDVLSRSFKLYDNPSLTQEYIDRLSRQYTGIWKQRYIDGLWVVAEGLIYTSYKPDVHNYTQDIVYYDEALIGIDVGSDWPTCYELIKKKENKYFNDNEWWHDPRETMVIKTITTLVNNLEQFVNVYVPEHIPLRIYVDETAREFIAECRQRDHRVSGILEATTKNPTDRVQHVDALYGTNRLFQHKTRTPVASRENTYYIWDEKKAEKGVDLPGKSADIHAVEARDYALYMDSLSSEPGNIR